MSFTFCTRISLLLSVLFLMCNSPLLQAEGWGKSEKTQKFEGTEWNEVYFDMNGLNFSAQIPNYSGTSLQNKEVVLCGNVKNEFIYAIVSSVQADFNPPNKIEAFVQLVQENNPDFQIVVVPSRNMGGKYIVDLIPSDKIGLHWRFVCTKDRIIQMATDDTLIKRRQYFFDSILIKEPSKKSK